MDQAQAQLQQQEPCDAVTFLERVGLGVYSPVFFSHGFTTIDSLLTIRHEDLTRMSVKAKDQQKLKVALEHYRATGQIVAPAETPPQPPTYTPQLPAGGVDAMATGALAGATGVAGIAGVAGSLGAPGAAFGQHYGKGGLWIDTNQPGEVPPYQWVDGPPGAAHGIYPAHAAQLQAQQQAAAAASPFGHYPQGAGAQWVDSPSGPAAAPPVAQDMVFQWVDSPSHGRLHQQHYLPAPQVSPYAYPGLDPSGLGHLDALRSPSALHGRGLDPLSPYAAAQGIDAGLAGLPQYGAQGLADATRYAPAHDPTGLYDHLGGYSNPPSPQQVGHHGQRRDLQSQYPHGRSDGRDHYGGQGYQLFDQSGRGQGKGQRQGQDRQGQKKQGMGADHDGSRARGRGRQDGNDAAPGARGNVTQAANDSATFERTMGPEALRAMLVSALESLYEDRIKPMANYVKGRLKERSCPDSLVKNFADLYGEHPDLFEIVRPSQLD